MKKIINEKGTGKTVKLMQYAANNNIAYIICKNAERSIIIAHENNFKNLKFIQYDELDSMHYLTSHEIPFLVDDLDDFLEYAFNGLKGYTISI